MKKRIPTILATALVMVLVFSLGLTALAASGQVSFGGVNIAMFGEKKVDAGEDFTAANGAQVPASITYTDEKNGGTTYLPIRLISQLLDTNIAWRPDSNTINFGVSDAAYDGGGIEISFGGQADPVFERVDSPVLGTQAGPFTEVAPRAEQGRSVVFLDNADFRSSTGFVGQFFFAGTQYDYVEITITNHGVPVGFTVSQANMLRGDDKARLSDVLLETGESMTRAFTVGDSDSELSRWLNLNVEALGGGGKITDITANVTMYLKK